jgi:hypothetical protein
LCEFLDDSALVEAARMAAATTVATFTEGTTEDDDEHDDDEPMKEHEIKDETNDGEENAKIFPSKKKKILDTKLKMFIFIIFLSGARCQHLSDFLRMASGYRFLVAHLWNFQAPIEAFDSILVCAF